MGFKITVEYPVDKVEVKAVSRGELTSKGNFNTNFGINDGKFDVLWNNTENVNGDGTLFVITAISKTPITKLMKPMMYFIGVYIVTLIIISIIPGLATWIPSLVT